MREWGRRWRRRVLIERDTYNMQTETDKSIDTVANKHTKAAKVERNSYVKSNYQQK